MTNINAKTGIPFGYISANALHPEIVDELQQGEDPHYAVNLAEYLRTKRAEIGESDDTPPSEREFDEDYHTDVFNDNYQPDEPIHRGVKDGVNYQTSWLGGALNVWIFESPFITHNARRASPCVPGAAILDTLDGSETGYDVPPNWRWEDEAAAQEAADLALANSGDEAAMEARDVQVGDKQ